MDLPGIRDNLEHMNAFAVVFFQGALFSYVFSVFSLYSGLLDPFRLNGYHHVFPLIEIYRFMQLPSRTDDINFIFGRFSDLFFFFSKTKNIFLKKTEKRSKTKFISSVRDGNCMNR